MLKALAAALCLLLVDVCGTAYADATSASCPPNREMVNGGCLPACQAPQVRNAAGACVCPANTTMGQNGVCAPNQPTCPANAARNDTGVCVEKQECPSGLIWANDRGMCVRG